MTRASALALALFATVVDVQAGVITFTHTGIGSGTIGTTSFTNAAFTFTGVGNTANRQNQASDIFFINHDSASVTIEGVGSFDFITGTRTVVNQSTAQDPTKGVVSFAHSTGLKLSLYNGPVDTAFSDWDMLTSIGPISGNTSTLAQWDSALIESVSTTGGILRFDTETDITGSFEANLSATAVPEPSTTMLVGLSILGVWARRQRARKTARERSLATVAT